MMSECGSCQEEVRASTAVKGIVRDNIKSESDRLKIKMFLKYISQNFFAIYHNINVLFTNTAIYGFSLAN